ncbi:MAG: Smr/MutS family protein [Rectinema sp.]|nr:Smr/MutS family protein [Rectinema sp.]
MGLDNARNCDIHSVDMAGIDPRNMLEHWLETHGTVDKDRGVAEDADEGQETGTYARFKRMSPQAELDLHGMREAEARAAIRSFLARAAAAGLEKVAIIHGKGNHSQEAQVLAKVAREEIEHSPIAGAFCFADGRRGGRGVTWVRIRQSTISRDR